MGIIYPTHFNNSVTLPVESLYLEVCADEYTAHAAPFFTSSPIQSDTNSALNSIEVWQSEQCTFVEAESNPFVISRNEQHVQNAGHLIQATRYIKGSAQGVM